MCPLCDELSLPIQKLLFLGINLNFILLFLKTYIVLIMSLFETSLLSNIMASTLLENIFLILIIS